MKIYVGNLPNSTSQDELSGIFSEFGDVQSAKIITDRDTGRSRGFGFVEMDDSAAGKAIDKLNNTDYQGRTITVNQARERAR